MWARHIEAMLGIWLGISQFIFRYSKELLAWKINDLISMILIIFFALITYKERFRYLHLCNVLVGLYLMGWVFLRKGGVGFPPDQNYMVLGFLLLMLGIVPSRTKQPPRAWVHFLNKF